MYQNKNLIKRNNKMTNKVLLTGISGWIAKHIAIELLNSGYEVLGTVRSQNSLDKTKKTLSEYVSTDKLSFVELDLLKDDGWVEAAKDCKYIIHTASPYPMKSSRNREALVPAAKGGALRVLNAGIEANVEKIILTSSIAAMFKKPNRTNPYTFGENDWSDTDWSGSYDYIVSKTKAEQAAWKLMESKGLKDKLTVINPGGVFGDALDKKTNTSTSYVELFLKGKYPMAPDFGILISDVKDVARAHVLSIKNSKVNGRRLIIGSEVKKMLELSKIMQEAFPKYAKKLPKKEMPIFMAKLISYFDSSVKKLLPDLGILMQTDTSYSEDLLGMKFKPAKDSIIDAGNSVIRLGLV
jgi:nucleoside-diphosphate-sugar epimerase